MSKEFRVNILNWSGHRLVLDPNDTTNFLRKDGTFAAPPASSGSSPSTGNGLMYFFSSGISNGVNQQFISFPVLLGANPTVLASVENNTLDTVIPMQISGSNTSGFWAVFANTIPNTGYTINVGAAATSLTGSVASVTVNNTTTIISGSQVSVTGGPVMASAVLTGVGSVIVTQTGNNVYIIDSNLNANMGTGLGVFSGINGPSANFYSVAASTGLQVNQSAGSPITYSTFLGTQIVVNVTGTVPMQSGNFFYQALSGTLTPGTWLGIVTVSVGSFSGCNLVAKLWNGNTGTGIFAAKETSIPTLGFGAGGSGILASGFCVLDFTTIITTQNITPITLHIASTLTGCRVLSTTAHFNTGENTTSISFMNFTRLY